MSPTRQHTYACPVQLTIDIVGGKWHPLILWSLRNGRPSRFNDLQRAMPDVAHKVLTQHLRQLECDGLVSRSMVGDAHRHVDYCLTAFGATLRPALNEMAACAKRHHRRFGATISPPELAVPLVLEPEVNVVDCASRGHLDSVVGIVRSRTSLEPVTTPQSTVVEAYVTGSPARAGAARRRSSGGAQPRAPAWARLRMPQAQAQPRVVHPAPDQTMSRQASRS